LVLITVALTYFTLYPPSQNQQVGTSNTMSQPTTSATSVSSSTTSSSKSTESCDVSKPLSLVKASLYSAESLETDWSNCSNQNIFFSITGGNSKQYPAPVTVTISLFGNSSTVQAHLWIPAEEWPEAYADGCCKAVYTPIEYSESVSPNAVITRITGNLTAVDPTTQQPLSMTSQIDIFPSQ
jgi:hypothetical protein